MIVMANWAINLVELHLAMPSHLLCEILHARRWWMGCEVDEVCRSPSDGLPNDPMSYRKASVVPISVEAEAHS
jgi:hypothetical protein